MMWANTYSKTKVDPVQKWSLIKSMINKRLRFHRKRRVPPANRYLSAVENVIPTRSRDRSKAGTVIGPPLIGQRCDVWHRRLVFFNHMLADAMVVAIFEIEEVMIFPSCLPGKSLSFSSVLIPCINTGVDRKGKNLHNSKANFTGLPRKLQSTLRAVLVLFRV